MSKYQSIMEIMFNEGNQVESMAFWPIYMYTLRSAHSLDAL